MATKLAIKIKDGLKTNPLFFVGSGLEVVCSNCGGKGKKAPFYLVWNESLRCSKCGSTR